MNVLQNDLVLSKSSLLGYLPMKKFHEELLWNFIDFIPYICVLTFGRATLFWIA